MRVRRRDLTRSTRRQQAACYDSTMAPTAHFAGDLRAETYRWSRDAYDRAVAAGVFGPEDRIELIDGELLTMTPQGSRHAAVATRVGARLARALGDHGHVRTQMPLAAGGDSEPEPDLAVVPGDDLDYLDAHPSTALLVVEVADDSLRRDRTVKQRLYARCGILEYWIVSLPDARLEVYRRPVGEAYRDTALLHAGDTVAPLAAPTEIIPVADLLP